MTIVAAFSLISFDITQVNPLNTRRHLNLRKTFTKRPGLLMYAQYVHCIQGVILRGNK